MLYRWQFERTFIYPKNPFHLWFLQQFFVVPFLSSEADGSCQEALRLQPTLCERWNLRVNNWFEWRADPVGKGVTCSQKTSRHAKTNETSFPRKYRYKPRLLDFSKLDLQEQVTFLRVLRPWNPGIPSRWWRVARSAAPTPTPESEAQLNVERYIYKCTSKASQLWGWTINDFRIWMSNLMKPIV